MGAKVQKKYKITILLQQKAMLLPLAARLLTI